MPCGDRSRLKLGLSLAGDAIARGVLSELREGDTEAEYHKTAQMLPDVYEIYQQRKALK